MGQLECFGALGLPGHDGIPERMLGGCVAHPIRRFLQI